MIFSLEILQANQGDCLILYYGSKDNPDIILIDGGPAGIYRNFLRPRLETLKSVFAPDGPLDLSMVMVSHLDDDHVNGILAFTSELVDNKENEEEAGFSFKNIWCNTFDDIIGNTEVASIIAAAGASTTTAAATAFNIPASDSHIAAVIATTGQGRKVRDNAKLLVAAINNPFKPAAAGKGNLVHDGKPAIAWKNGLKIKVIHPNEQRLAELQKKWDQDLKKAKKAGDNSIIMASITDPDKSPFNLSSIVCLVEYKSKKILLTGDARGDDITEGLKKNKLLDVNGKFHVDVLKLPHHGSIRNMDADFFKTISADHYVISANGKYDNPDKELLDIFAEEVKSGTLHITNHDGEKNLKKKLDAFGRQLLKLKSKVKINYRDPDSSIMVDLIDKVSF